MIDLNEGMTIMSRHDEVVFLEVDQQNWSDMERLFEGRGGPQNCWCMVWRGTAADRQDKERRKRAMHQLVQDHVPVGLLGYVDGEPVAWCSIAPRATYRFLGGWDDPHDPEERVWSLACFFVVRRVRRQGVMAALLRAAVDHARQRGATAVEAYPVDLDSPSYRFMGFRHVFEQHGFVKVGKAGSRRHVMRLPLKPSHANEYGQ